MHVSVGLSFSISPGGNPIEMKFFNGQMLMPRLVELFLERYEVISVIMKASASPRNSPPYQLAANMVTSRSALLLKRFLSRNTHS